MPAIGSREREAMTWVNHSKTDVIGWIISVLKDDSDEHDTAHSFTLMDIYILQ